ncbi:hypothetical protein MMC22_004748 [Lobaria immixta]|nr:hypothetical protein [Lobaria immixta]
MVVFAFVFASLAALFSSFLSLSPTSFHGLGPWMDTLGTRPVAPTPVASPKAFFPLEFWEAIPTANLSASEVVAPPPMPTSSFVLEEEVGGQAFAEPPPEQPEEPTVEELLRELWWLVKMSLLCLTLDVNDFIREHWPLALPKVSCSRLRWVNSPAEKEQAKAANPEAGQPVEQERRGRKERMVVGMEGELPSDAPSWGIELDEHDNGPIEYGHQNEGDGLPAFSPSASASELPSSSGDQSRLESVLRARWYTKRREQQKRIFELEDEVDALKARIEKMESDQSAPVPAATTAHPPPPSSPSAQLSLSASSALPSPPPPPSSLSAQLSLSASSALPSSPPPPPPPPRHPHVRLGLNAGSGSFYPRPPGHGPKSVGSPPPPLPLQQQRPNLGPHGYGQSPRPHQLSPEEFRKKYPQTGSKKQKVE